MSHLQEKVQRSYKFNYQFKTLTPNIWLTIMIHILSTKGEENLKRNGNTKKPAKIQKQNHLKLWMQIHHQNKAIQRQTVLML